MRLLVLNPNTTVSMTDAVVAQVRALVDPAVEVIGATAASGTPVIASRETYAIGAEAALHTLQAFEDRLDGVLLACFGDPGLEALRAHAGCPVEALAEAAVRAAQARGERFAIITVGREWEAMLAERVEAMGASSSCVGIHALSGTGLQLAADPPGYRRAVESAARDAAERGAEAIILGGAAFAGLSFQLDERLRVIDPVAEATHALLATA